MTRRPPAQPPRKPHAGMASLSRDLSELERTDPAVKAGAEAYDRMVAKVLTGQNEPTMVTFGRELRDLRVRHGLSLRDLARMLRTEDVALANVERGVVARATCPRPEGE